MPLIVKDYKWEESDSMVYITVPLKGVRSNKVDIFSTEEYVKVSFSCIIAHVCKLFPWQQMHLLHVA